MPDTDNTLTTPNPLPQRPGGSAELFVAAALLHMGHQVAIPLLQQPRYDLILGVGHALYRVQVKWAQRLAARVRKQGRGDRPHYTVNLHKQRYTPQDFDLLVAVCEVDLIYYLPMAHLCAATGRVPWQVRIKVEAPSTRKDVQRSIERWQPYKNQLVLPGVTVA